METQTQAFYDSCVAKQTKITPNKIPDCIHGQTLSQVFYDFHSGFCCGEITCEILNSLNFFFRDGFNRGVIELESFVL